MFKVGQRVIIVNPSHPHHNEHGTIVAHATRGPASVGLEWEIALANSDVEGCFVSGDEIQRI